ncbi:MAG: DUF839 domain-containing protein [Acidobacteria bacterium]|nr:DUF839 domain-containing protein [Acidobacteriota bacterium]
MANSQNGRLSRRGLLRAGAGGAGLFGALEARAESVRDGRAEALTSPGYGFLRPAGNELMLPPGFQYTVVSWEGDQMADGFPVPKAMDGMGAFPLANGNIMLIRNHEDAEPASRLRPRPAGSTSTSAGILSHLLGTDFGPRSFAYDAFTLGGTTSIEVDARTRRKIREWWSLVGTWRNCAGGVTPWGSWLSCEETLEQQSAAGTAQNHGYAFEVPVDTAPGRPVTPVALKQLGRFAHEAAAVDPRTGIIYETEDQGDVSGFYRFVPERQVTKPGELATMGGRLQMMRVGGVNGYETALDQKVGVKLAVSWVDVPNPDPVPPSLDVNGVTRSAVFHQGLNNGGAIWRRLEGIWYWERKIYFTATNGGNEGLGQIWVYEPDTETVWLLFETPHLHLMDFPDNIAVSPRGGLVVCEDGGGAQHLLGVSPAGELFYFAKNIHSSTEFAGACFSPDGETLFVNIYGRSTIRTTQPYKSPLLVPIGSEFGEKAMTLAIWGPWGKGLL